LLIPVWRLQEYDKEGSAAQDRVQRHPFKEAVQRVGPSLREVGLEAAAADVRHVVLVRQRRDGALWEFFGQLFPQEDEVREAPPDGEFGALEGLEVGLGDRVSLLASYARR
jgi:hypothetical protein